MKLLYDHQIFLSQKYGGASRYFYELINRSAGLFDWEVTGKYSENIYAQALSVHKNFPLKFNFKGKYKIMNFINKNDTTRKLKNSRFDVIHSTLYESYLLKKKKAPLLITVHDMIHEIFPEYFDANDDYSIKKQNMILNADKINVNSIATKNDLLKFFPQVEQKITITYLACSSRIWEQTQKKENYILFTGQRASYKNFLNFISAVAPLLNKYDLKLMCTGNSFNAVESAKFNELEIHDRVFAKFAREDELEDLYAKALVFVFPSLYEGFGIPMLEAFSSGCPVIASNAGSLPEIGGDGAVYFDPYNIDDMRTTIENVLLSPALQNQMIQKGWERARMFSWEKCVNETAAVYCGLLK
jgi:glycosyltransferase involved in cell wall biosynthesis